MQTMLSCEEGETGRRAGIDRVDVLQAVANGAAPYCLGWTDVCSSNLGGRNPGRKEFQSEKAIELCVFGLVDYAHPPTTKAFKDMIVRDGRSVSDSSPQRARSNAIFLSEAVPGREHAPSSRDTSPACHHHSPRERKIPNSIPRNSASPLILPKSE